VLMDSGLSHFICHRGKIKCCAYVVLNPIVATYYCVNLIKKSLFSSYD
jgi:hypothetical protein